MQTGHKQPSHHPSPCCHMSFLFPAINNWKQVLAETNRSLSSCFLSGQEAQFGPFQVASGQRTICFILVASNMWKVSRPWHQSLNTDSVSDKTLLERRVWWLPLFVSGLVHTQQELYSTAWTLELLWASAMTCIVSCKIYANIIVPINFRVRMACWLELLMSLLLFIILYDKHK